MRLLAVASVLAVSAVAAALAQVAVEDDPTHRATFENAQLRILNVNIPASGASADHRHAFDTVTISMSDGPATRHQTGGGAPAAQPARPVGDVAIEEYTGKAATHRIENTGKSPVRMFAIENLKKSGWSTTPATSGRATTRITESRAFRVYDVRLAAQESQTSHRHAVPTIVVLVAGGIMSDGPDTHAKANAPAPVGLKQLTAPGEWLLVPAGDTHHIVRLGPRDARVVEVEVR